jgi:hypothetical protein
MSEVARTHAAVSVSMTEAILWTTDVAGSP